MSTDRISRLQSLLEKIKKNAALPKRPLGSNLFFGVTQDTRDDVSTGPALPTSSVMGVQNDVAPPRRPPLPPIAAAEGAAHQPAPATESHTPTLSGPTHVPTLTGTAAVRPISAGAVSQTPPPGDVVEELDLDDVDVVDVTSDQPPPTEVSSVEVSHVVSVAGSVQEKAPPVRELDELHWTEPPILQEEPLPDSSPRPRSATSLDEALADAAAESEQYAPLRTPPPQSGRQPTDGAYSTSIPEPSPSELLPMPTAEQLGHTLELEAPTGAALELDLETANAQKAKEDLEFELPPAKSELEPPVGEQTPTTAKDSSYPASHRRSPEQSQILDIPDDGDTIEMAAIVAPQEMVEPSTDRDLVTVNPELTVRRAQSQSVVPEFVHAARRYAPRSFAELLDASLKLGR